MINDKPWLSAILVLSVLVGSDPAPAAESGDWMRVRQLHAGQKVEIQAQEGKKLTGTLAQASEDGISIRTRGGEQFLPRQGVRQVKAVPVGREHNRAAGVAAGLIGTGISIVLLNMNKPPMFQRDFGWGAVRSIPMFVGYAIAFPLAITGRSKVVYEVPRSASLRGAGTEGRSGKSNRK